jgi:SAM-dependent methyltransferase
MNEGVGFWQVRRDIWVSLCLNCGTVFENPQINVLESREYNEVHYYNKWFNEVEGHDRLQNSYAPFRWKILADKIRWDQVRRAIDVGATGAWSAILKKNNPHIESLLIEPSKAAIDFCTIRYPDVVPIHGILEEYAPTESLDVITFFYSLYHITNPVDVLKACRERLAENGQLMVCISHAHLEIEMYGSNKITPWVDMEHYVRGAPLIYFSRRTLTKTIERAGFKISEEFVAEHADEGEWKGRQDFFVIATKGEPRDIGDLSDPGEVTWARDFVKNYCVNASVNSLKRLLSQKNVSNTALVCEDDVYAEWILKVLSDHKCAPRRFRSADCNATELREYLARPDSVLLNATWVPLAGSGECGDSSIDCIQGKLSPGNYGLWTPGANNEVIITKAFLPVREFFMGPSRVP